MVLHKSYTVFLKLFEILSWFLVNVPESYRIITSELEKYEVAIIKVSLLNGQQRKTIPDKMLSNLITD